LTTLGYRSVVHHPSFEDLKTLDGGADNGVLLFYKYLDYKFPKSKFVLTIRELDEWLESMEFALGKYPMPSRDSDSQLCAECSSTKRSRSIERR
jgi:hypothetical protein